MAHADVAELGTASRRRAHDLFGRALDQMRPGTLVLSDPAAAHAGWVDTIRPARRAELARDAQRYDDDERAAR
jgi:hypothetical protein